MRSSNPLLRATGQVTPDAAEVYEEFFVPALFLQWASRVVDAAQLKPGQNVVDVACGTGVLAREAARRVRPRGEGTGLDRNEGMLAVARRKAPDVDWQLGMAESLPFADGAMDAVISQFGLMFFEDRRAALKEMWRVVRPAGQIAIAVWAGLDRTPGYAAMTALLQRLFGDRVADALRAPFALGDPETLRSEFSEAGIPGIEIRTADGTARFPSIESWVHTDVKGWTLADLIDNAQYGRLLRAAQEDLATYVRRDGTVAFGCAAHIVIAAKP